MISAEAIDRAAATLKLLDPALVLQRGYAWLDTGTHESLLAKNGLYAALWQEQSARREAA